MRTIGFMVSELGASQLGFHLLKESNRALGETTGLDIVCFYQNMAKPWVTPLFATMNAGEAFGFSGVLLATDFHTAKKLISIPGPTHKFFYVWSLDWGSRPWVESAQVYGDPSVKLIARNLEHSEVIANCWNRDVFGIVDNFNISQILKLVGE